MRRPSLSVLTPAAAYNVLLEPSPPKRRGSPSQLLSSAKSHTMAAPKKRYMHNWENIFGHHSAHWSLSSLVALVQKEGKAVVFLIVLGASVSVLDYGINEAIVALKWLQARFVAGILGLAPATAANAWGVPFAAVLIWSAVFACISVAWTRFVDPLAAGSGIPEIKTILSADSCEDPGRYLRSRTLFAKSLGLVTAQASGLSVGKEGPFVHTACILSHQFMKHGGCFARLYRNESLHRHMYNAACAVGVASTFGAPIGGVLFSIEVTSSFFLLTNYWRAFVAAVSGSITKQTLDYITRGQQPGFHSFQALYPTSYSDASFRQLEMIAFAGLGLLMGVAGAAYVRGATLVRERFAPMNRARPLKWGTFVAVVVAVIVYCPGPFTRLSIADALGGLTSPAALAATWRYGEHVFGPLAVYFASRMLVTMMSVALPVPSGDFLPLFSAGAAFGRLYGEALAAAFPDVPIVPGGYALVGGASLVAASTQTISVAVIALELTGQFIYFTPLFLAVLLSCGTSKGLSVSIYDSAIISKGLPYLPMLRCNELRTERIGARDVMQTEVACLADDTTLADVAAFLDANAGASIPVVTDGRLLAGCAGRDELAALVAAGTDLSQPVVLSASLELSGNVLKVDEDTPLETVHLLFEMLKCSKLFVTRFGVLLGVVTRGSMHARLTYLPATASAVPRDDIVC
ncbi:hypothetical protein ACHHYP_13058 [Achlya hypogyna]|uniref:CBS domain-containing protein n=1 Tax=Achlya hypogyna TaxID=1202772 RepID=A0A1V9YG29_ACHHY|nr:hypothetical protein ACHHYP_13058 [Achlya hypogyna]